MLFPIITSMSRGTSSVVVVVFAVAEDEDAVPSDDTANVWLPKNYVIKVCYYKF